MHNHRLHNSKLSCSKLGGANPPQAQLDPGLAPPKAQGRGRADNGDDEGPARKSPRLDVVGLTGRSVWCHHLEVVCELCAACIPELKHNCSSPAKRSSTVWPSVLEAMEQPDDRHIKTYQVLEAMEQPDDRHNDIKT